MHHLLSSFKFIKYRNLTLIIISGTALAIACFTIYNFFLTDLFLFKTFFKSTKTSFSDIILMGFWIFNFGKKEEVLPRITSYRQINSTLKESLLKDKNLDNETLTEKARVLSILSNGLRTDYQGIQSELQRTKDLMRSNKNLMTRHPRGSPHYRLLKSNQAELRVLKSNWLSEGKNVSQDYASSKKRIQEVNAEILADLASFSLEKSLTKIINGLDISFTKVLGDGHLKEIFFSGFMAVVFVAFVIITKESIIFLYHFNETQFYKGFLELVNESWRYIKTLLGFYTVEDLPANSSTSTGQFHIQNDTKPVTKEADISNTNQPVTTTKTEGFNWTFWGAVTAGTTVVIYGIRYILKK